MSNNEGLVRVSNESWIILIINAYQENVHNIKDLKHIYTHNAIKNEILYLNGLKYSTLFLFKYGTLP